MGFNFREAAKGPQLDFEHEEEYNGGSKRPNTHTLHGVHPETGDQVGWLKYDVPKRKADKIYVQRLEVHPEHRGNGYANQLMDEMQQRHPGTPIDHGDRTDDGQGWWNSYTQGKSVRKGRTIAALEEDDDAGSVDRRGGDLDQATGPQEPEAVAGDETPASCSYCGSTAFTNLTDNGRVRQATCAACGGTMSAHDGAQWTPELIGDPSNHPSPNPDPRSGGVGGAGAAATDPLVRDNSRLGAYQDYAPNPGNASPMHNVEPHMPGFYANPEGYSDFDADYTPESVSAIQHAYGRPDHMVTVHRALPAEHAHGGIQAGDWVTPARAHAQDHADYYGRGQNWKIISKDVPAGHLYTTGNPNEWGYHPQGRTAARIPSATCLTCKGKGTVSWEENDPDWEGDPDDNPGKVYTDTCDDCDGKGVSPETSDEEIEAARKAAEERAARSTAEHIRTKHPIGEVVTFNDVRGCGPRCPVGHEWDKRRKPFYYTGMLHLATPEDDEGVRAHGLPLLHKDDTLEERTNKIHDHYDHLEVAGPGRLAKLTEPEMHELLTRFGHNHRTGEQHSHREHTLTPVKHAGFKGYVEGYEGQHEDQMHEDREAYGSRHPEGGFDEDLWDHVAPSWTTHEREHHEEWGEHPDQDDYDERHAAAYEKAKQDRDEAVKPVAHHGGVFNMLANEMERNYPAWHTKGEIKKVDVSKHNVYATQPHVVDKHINRYLKNPGDTVAHVKEHGMNLAQEMYPGTHRPMFIKHENNLFTVEGHHRTASALLRKEPVEAHVYDADKHGFPHYDDDEDYGESYDKHEGLQKHSMLMGADCDFDIDDPREANLHAMRHHDDGVCTLTEAARHRESQRNSKEAAVDGPDWCTWRHAAQCTFPNDRNNTILAIPQVRGACPWTTRYEQQLCPISEPGPMALMQHKGSKALSWDEIGDRHPEVYGDSEIHGDAADGADGPGIGDAANYLAHERPGHQDAEDSAVHDLEFHEQTVHPRHIDYSPSGSDDPRVRSARQGYQQHPDQMPPLVLVKRHNVYHVADGHHRAEAAHGLDIPVRAYVADSPYPNEPFSDGEKGASWGAEPISVKRRPKKEAAMAIPCQTPGAQFHTSISDSKVGLTVDLHKNLNLSESEAEVLEANMHNAMELVLRPYYSSLSVPQSYELARVARQDPEMAFHLTAAWSDVRNKAKRIRSEGKVQIKTATSQGLAGTVEGDHGTYDNMITYRPGTRKIADWHCDCKWGDWAWDRIRFHGRQCSHSLALQYEAQSRGMFGKEIRLGQLSFGATETIDELSGISDRPIEVIAKALIEAEEDPGDIMKVLMAYGLPHSGALDLIKHPEGQHHTGSANMAETEEERRRKKHHRTNDTRRHAPYFGYGVPGWLGLPIGWCPQCDGSGCGHCGGTGQVAQDGNGNTANPVPDQNGDEGQMTSGGISDTSSLHPRYATGSTTAVSLSTADQAATGSAIDGYGFRGVGMPLGTSRLAGVDGGRGVSGVDVVREGLDGHVIQPHAQPVEAALSTNGGTPGIAVVAGVVEDELRWDLPDRQQPHEAMQVVRFPLIGGSAVPVATSGTSPHVAGVAGSEHDLVKQAGGKQEVPTVAGVCLKAADTGRILMLQRGLQDEDDPARGTWENPGGHIEPGDQTSLHAGIREFEEEVGQPFPEGGVVHHTWTSPNGIYQGHVVVIPSEKDLRMHEGRVIPNPDDPKGDNHEQAAWWDIDHARKNPALREELKTGTPWKEIANAGMQKAASAWDPLTGEGETPGFPYAAPLHSNSQNPASTGFATSEDPKSWDFEQQIPQHLLPSNSYDSGGYYGMLHDEPEGALPFTDGSDEDGYQPPETNSSIPEDDGSLSPNQFTGSVQDIVSSFQATAGAKGIMADTPATSGGGDMSFDYAAAARQYLAQDKGLRKSALKDFSFPEQQELINEGKRDDVRARNFGNLQIEGTHYEALSRALGLDEEDPEALFT